MKTVVEQDSSIAWASRVNAAIGVVQESERKANSALTSDSAQDLQAIFSARDKLAALGSADDSDSRHDRMNIIGAVRGYAEMLYEDRDALPHSLSSTLKHLLEAVYDLPEQPDTPPEEGALSVTLDADDVGVILTVDDMPENRELVTRLLSKSGHTVLTAESGEEALELLATRGVDVVLLDLMMPGIGGAEVLRRMKDDERLRATPVVMISGRQDMTQIIACIEAGADDYLLKPFNPVLLQARIAAGIERKRWHDREERYREQLERSEKFIRATFGRYLSDAIVDEILESPEGLKLGGDLCEVTIMMSDIRGFTTLSEQLPPEQVVTMLNRYLGAMIEIILQYGGTIDEFLGDAVLAVFGAPRSREDDADRAVQCAIAMQAAMEGVNKANAADNLPTLHMALALNTGTVVAGNIGSERRSKYGFVGHAMNVTSRIEDAARRDEILISDSTLAKLKQPYLLSDKRQIAAKGIEEVVIVHSVKGVPQ